MSLFKIEDLKEPEEVETKTKSKAQKTQEKIICRLGKASKKVSEVIGNVKMGESIHYASIGDWSMHDLLFHLLKQTGPAKVYISTWSVSENAVRMLIDKMNNGEITKMSAVFDWRVKMRRPEAFELAKFNISDIRLTTCHAKVTVIENDEWNISIVGSANYTNNPRIESGVISCDKTASGFHKFWITEEIKVSDPFDTIKKRKKL